MVDRSSVGLSLSLSPNMASGQLISPSRTAATYVNSCIESQAMTNMSLGYNGSESTSTSITKRRRSAFDIIGRPMAISPEDLKLQKFVQSVLNNALLDDTFDMKLRWLVRAVHSIDCRKQKEAYRQKVTELYALGVNSRELAETHLFAGFSHLSTAEDVFCNGLSSETQHADPLTVAGAIGNSAKGVYLLSHPDVLLRLAHAHKFRSIYLVIFQVTLGRQRPIEPPCVIEPTDNYDCHISSMAPRKSGRLQTQLSRSQVYMYEADPNSLNGYSSRPRQCLPIAYIVLDRIDCKKKVLPTVPATSLGQPSLARVQVRDHEEGYGDIRYPAIGRFPTVQQGGECPEDTQAFDNRNRGISSASAVDSSQSRSMDYRSLNFDTNFHTFQSSSAHPTIVNPLSLRHPNDGSISNNHLCVPANVQTGQFMHDGGYSTLSSATENCGSVNFGSREGQCSNANRSSYSGLDKHPAFRAPATTRQSMTGSFHQSLPVNASSLPHSLDYSSFNLPQHHHNWVPSNNVLPGNTAHPVSVPRGRMSASNQQITQSTAGNGGLCIDSGVRCNGQRTVNWRAGCARDNSQPMYGSIENPTSGKLSTYGLQNQPVMMENRNAPYQHVNSAIQQGQSVECSSVELPQAVRINHGDFGHAASGESWPHSQFWQRHQHGPSIDAQRTLPTHGVGSLSSMAPFPEQVQGNDVTPLQNIERMIHPEVCGSQAVRDLPEKIRIVFRVLDRHVQLSSELLYSIRNNLQVLKGKIEETANRAVSCDHYYDRLNLMIAVQGLNEVIELICCSTFDKKFYQYRCVIDYWRGLLIGSGKFNYTSLYRNYKALSLIMDYFRSLVKEFGSEWRCEHLSTLIPIVCLHAKKLGFVVHHFRAHILQFLSPTFLVTDQQVPSDSVRTVTHPQTRSNGVCAKTNTCESIQTVESVNLNYKDRSFGNRRYLTDESTPVVEPCPLSDINSMSGDMSKGIALVDESTPVVIPSQLTVGNSMDRSMNIGEAFVDKITPVVEPCQVTVDNRSISIVVKLEPETVESDAAAAVEDSQRISRDFESSVLKFELPILIAPQDGYNVDNDVKLWTFKRNFKLDLTNVDDGYDNADFVPDDSALFLSSDSYHERNDVVVECCEMSAMGESSIATLPYKSVPIIDSHQPDGVNNLSVVSFEDEADLPSCQQLHISRCGGLENSQNVMSKGTDIAAATVHLGIGAANAISVNLSHSYVDSMLSMLPSTQPVENYDDASRGLVFSEVAVNGSNLQMTTTSKLASNTSGINMDKDELINEVIAGSTSSFQQPLTDVSNECSSGSSSTDSVEAASRIKGDALSLSTDIPITCLPERKLTTPMAAASQVVDDSSKISFVKNIVKCEGDVTMTFAPFHKSSDIDISDENQQAGTEGLVSMLPICSEMITKIESRLQDISSASISCCDSGNVLQQPLASVESCVCDTFEHCTSAAAQDSASAVERPLTSSAISVRGPSASFSMNQPQICATAKTADSGINSFVLNSSRATAVAKSPIVKYEDDGNDITLSWTERGESIEVDVEPHRCKMELECVPTGVDCRFSEGNNDMTTEEDAGTELCVSERNPLKAGLMSPLDSVISTANQFGDQISCSFVQSSGHQEQSDGNIAAKTMTWPEKSCFIEAEDMSLLPSDMLDQVVAEQEEAPASYCITSTETGDSNRCTRFTENSHELLKELAVLEEDLRRSSFGLDVSHGLGLEQLEFINNTEMTSRQRLICNITRTMLSAKAYIEAHRKTCTYEPVFCGESLDCQDHQTVNEKCVIMDLVSLTLVSLQYGYKTNHVMITLPAELRLSSEIGKYISAEGVPLFLMRQCISDETYFRLWALSRKISELVREPESSYSKHNKLKLRWYHNARRQTLASVCCTSLGHLRRLWKTVEHKLNLYRYVANKESYTLPHKFALSLKRTIPLLESYFIAMKHLQLNDAGKWRMIDSSSGSSRGGCNVDISAVAGTDGRLSSRIVDPSYLHMMTSGESPSADLDVDCNAIISSEQTTTTSEEYYAVGGIVDTARCSAVESSPQLESENNGILINASETVDCCDSGSDGCWQCSDYSIITDGHMTPDVDFATAEVGMVNSAVETGQQIAGNEMCSAVDTAICSSVENSFPLTSHYDLTIASPSNASESCSLSLINRGDEPMTAHEEGFTADVRVEIIECSTVDSSQHMTVSREYFEADTCEDGSSCSTNGSCSLMLSIDDKSPKNISKTPECSNSISRTMVDVNAKTPVLVEKNLLDNLLNDKQSATVESLHSKMQLKRTVRHIECDLANTLHPTEKEYSMKSDLKQVKPVAERSATSAMSALLDSARSTLNADQIHKLRDPKAVPVSKDRPTKAMIVLDKSTKMRQDIVLQLSEILRTKRNEVEYSSLGIDNDIEIIGNLDFSKKPALCDGLQSVDSLQKNKHNPEIPRNPEHSSIGQEEEEDSEHVRKVGLSKKRKLYCRFESNDPSLQTKKRKIGILKNAEQSDESDSDVEQIRKLKNKVSYEGITGLLAEQRVKYRISSSVKNPKVVLVRLSNKQLKAATRTVINSTPSLSKNKIASSHDEQKLEEKDYGSTPNLPLSAINCLKSMSSTVAKHANSPSILSYDSTRKAQRDESSATGENADKRSRMSLLMYRGSHDRSSILNYKSHSTERSKSKCSSYDCVKSASLLVPSRQSVPIESRCHVSTPSISSYIQSDLTNKQEGFGKAMLLSKNASCAPSLSKEKERSMITNNGVADWSKKNIKSKSKSKRSPSCKSGWSASSFIFSW